MESRGDRWQRDVHDGVVQADDEQTEAADAKNDQTAAAGQFGHGNLLGSVIARLSSRWPRNPLLR
jgi:hypothetical protein